MFRYQGHNLVNEHGKAMDISGNIDTENRNVEMHKMNGQINQQWDLIYADEYPAEPTKGQLNKEFGLYVERPFNIISQMKSNRYLELIDGRNLVIKTRNGRNTQEFYFDQTSKTIKNKSNNQSFDIQSNGKSNNLQVWSTNSGWW
jgi:hypothetical protein